MSLVARHAAVAAYPPLANYVGGMWISRESGGFGTVIDPSTKAALGRLPLADEADVACAIAAADRAFAGWRVTPAIERARLLTRVAAWLRERREVWSALIALELGKPLAQARLEADTACDLFDWAAGEARRLYGRTIPGRTANMRMMTIAEPIGPVAALSGWNAPAITPARKIAGAVAAGCSIVIKPSEATPATVLMIARAFEAADCPPGVVNMIFGDPPAVARCFATDPAIRMLTFTGGTAVGKELAALSATTLKRTVLELGGHAPVLVFADADIHTVAVAAAAAKYRNAGQICTSPTRFLVEEAAREQFTERFTAAAQALTVGDPFDPATQMGPLQNARRHAAIAAMIADARQAGATVTQGTAPDGPGFWHPPAVVSGHSEGVRAWDDEPFGPVALIRGFGTADEAIAEANRMSYGLAAYAFTASLSTAERLSREVQSGTLAINHWAASFPETPFGGLKESGLGSEGGIEGVAVFQQLRFVSVAS